MIKAGAPANFDGFATKQAASYAKMALTDKLTGKYLVDIMPDGRVPLATLQASLQSAFPLLEVKNIEPKYNGRGMANTPGVGGSYTDSLDTFNGDGLPSGRWS